jgi:hypothetical protein
MVMQGAGALSSASGAYAGAQSQKQSLALQANLADINARMSESAAQATLLTGQHEEQRSQIATANLKGTQRASLAASGVDLGVGSALNIQTTTDAMGEIDANTIHSNAVRSAWGYRTQGVNQSNQALMSRAASDAINPNQAATTSLIGSAGSVASSWYQFNKAGAFDMQPAPGAGDPRYPVRGQRGY